MDWTLVRGVRRQMEAFKDGFNSVFPLSNLLGFYPAEVTPSDCPQRPLNSGFPRAALAYTIVYAYHGMVWSDIEWCWYSLVAETLKGSLLNWVQYTTCKYCRVASWSTLHLLIALSYYNSMNALNGERGDCIAICTELATVEFFLCIYTVPTCCFLPLHVTDEKCKMKVRFLALHSKSSNFPHKTIGYCQRLRHPETLAVFLKSVYKHLDVGNYRFTTSQGLSAMWPTICIPLAV